MSMRVNTIIAPTATETSLEEAYRVLTFDGRTDKIWLMALKRPWKMPQEFTLSEIASSLSGDMPTRIVREAIPTPYMTVAEEKLPVHVKAVRDEAWECIEPLIAGIGGRNLCSASDRGSQIAARAQAKNMPLKSLYRMLYRYWIYGMTQNACLPNWPNCGRGKAPRRGRDRSVPLLPDRENPPVSDAQIEQVLPTSAQSPAKAEDASSKRSPPPIQIDRNRIGHPYKAATIAAAGVILDFNSQPEDLKIFRMAIDLFY